MNKILSSILCASALMTLASCENTGPNTQTGAVLGGLGGAAVGGIIGNQSGRGLEGAAIGAGLGALGGAAIGNSQDKRNAQAQQQYYYQQQQQGYPPRQPYQQQPYYR
jgi:uncharacterized protein YcfJ